MFVIKSRTNTMTAMLHLKDIHKSYSNIQVLKGLTLKVNEGEMVSVIGKSGAGKSTMLHIAGTLEKADSGEVFVNGMEVSKLKGKSLAEFRNQQVGFIFQFHYLLPEFNALENVLLPVKLSSNYSSSSNKHAKDLLDLLGLTDRMTHLPSELSGGEQQRVAIARALINKPSIVLADEPTGNLDSISSHAIHQLFLKLQKELKQTFVIVTHNPALAEICDRTVTMVDGTVHQ